jgi:hypothetical protein
MTLKKHLLNLRPHELLSYITDVKILRKYNRLPHKKEIEKTLKTIFKNNPYAFSWSLFYDKPEIKVKIPREKLDEYLMYEKKVLFKGFDNVFY